MSEKSQPSRSTSNAAPPYPKRPYKALLIRAQSPEPAKVNSTGSEATGSQMKSRKNNATRKAPYKALLIRARSPEPTEEISADSEETVSQELEVKPRENNTARKSPTSQEPEVGLTIGGKNKRRRISEKNNAREGTMSGEAEVKGTVAKKISAEEP